MLRTVFMIGLIALAGLFLLKLSFGILGGLFVKMAFSTLDSGLRPDGSSLMSLFRSFGGSIGISVIVTMLSRNQQVSHADVAAHVTANSIPGFDWTGTLDRMGPMGGAAMQLVNGEVSRQAMMIAFLDCFYILTWVMLAFAPLPFLLKRGKVGAQPEKMAMME